MINHGEVIVYKFAEGFSLKVSSNTFILAYNEKNKISLVDDHGSINMAQIEKMSKSEALFNLLLGLKQVDHLCDIRELEILMPFENLLKLSEEHFSMFSFLPKLPYSIKLSSSGILGLDFTVRYDFVLGRSPIACDVFGPFVYSHYARNFFRLSFSNFKLLYTLEKHISAPKHEKERADLLLVKTIRENRDNVELDEYLPNQEVIIPDKIGLTTFIHEDGEHISLIPFVEGVNPKLLREQFFRCNEPPNSLSILNRNGQRVTIVFQDHLKPAIEAIYYARCLAGQKKQEILKDPCSILPDGFDRETLGSGWYSDRVIGFTTGTLSKDSSHSSTKIDWFDRDGRKKFQIREEDSAIRIIYEDNDKPSVAIPREQLDEFVTALHNAVEANAGAFEFKGQKVFDPQEIKEVLEATGIVDNRKADEFKRKIDEIETDEKLKKHVFLQILKNTEDLSYKKGSLEIIEPPTHDCELPHNLRENIDIKPHQIEGIRWLQNKFRNRKNHVGCLLADEMGLGKTLQVLVFLQWAVEKYPDAFFDRVSSLYKSILIVAKVILLENWVREIERFLGTFALSPRVILHSNEIARYRYPGFRGHETKTQLEILNVTELRKNLVIITNYETLVNYQRSFAKIPFSVIVVDEAHNLNTVSHRQLALASLQSDFRVYLTGTPVENRMVELWTLFDTLAPGLVFRSRKEFLQKYDVPLNNPESCKKVLDLLKQDLQVNEPMGHLLSRGKDILNLPRIHVKKIACRLTEHLAIKYQEILRSFRQSNALSLLNQLRKLHTHEALLEDELESVALEKLRSSPKTKELIRVLFTIKSRNEKALIFVHTIAVHKILQRIIHAEFGFLPSSINSENFKSGSIKARSAEIDKFNRKEGFDVLILGLEIGCEGLTITGANHVIHFERWWNPAKENQATARAHRIGQQKEVYVYYFIYESDEYPKGTFDQKLDQLLQAKQKIASEVLLPAGSNEATEQSIQQELSEWLLQT
ncbi:MAG: DEAD/DEAH box helicase [Deltaproteobacteria bacterium]|nr:DEAD/DEAH box helicase [Deltaproteobacteria bacterium]